MEKDKQKTRLAKAEYQRKYRKSRKHFDLYYTKEELDSVSGNAANAGLEIATFIKDVSLRKKVIAVDPSRKNVLELKAEVRRIGINVNQIAKAMNDPYGLRDLDYFNKTLQEMNGKLEAILDELKTN